MIYVTYTKVVSQNSLTKLTYFTHVRTYVVASYSYVRMLQESYTCVYMYICTHLRVYGHTYYYIGMCVHHPIATYFLYLYVIIACTCLLLCMYILAYMVM